MRLLSSFVVLALVLCACWLAAPVFADEPDGECTYPQCNRLCDFPPGHTTFKTHKVDCALANGFLSIAGPVYPDNNKTCTDFLVTLRPQCVNNLQSFLCSQSCPPCTTDGVIRKPCSVLCTRSLIACPPAPSWPGYGATGAEAGSLCAIYSGMLDSMPGTCARRNEPSCNQVGAVTGPVSVAPPAGEEAKALTDGGAQPAIAG